MKFGELTVGQVFESSSYRMKKEEIIEFAEKYDPQYMHIDEEKAKQSRFKGIIASGLHTLSVAVRLWTDIGVMEGDVIAGTGMNHLKFLKPVFPDDVLYVKVEVIKKEERKANGEVTFLINTFKNDGELVLSTETSALFLK